MDVGNIGNALTDFFLDDVDITQTQFNFGQQLLALGIVLWEIPSNFVSCDSRISRMGDVLTTVLRCYTELVRPSG